jgi:hypothetical protein
MASGETLIIFTAHANEPPETGYATVDIRNTHMVLDFDDAAIENAVFSGMLARNYGGGGITATLVWAATTATAGDVKWNAAFDRHQSGTDDLDSDSFATAQTATATAPGTSGACLYTPVVFTDGAQIDALAAGESFRLKITRNATDAGDTLVGDAELLAVELRET